MRDILIAKFSDERLKKKLIKTYPNDLIGGNDCGDEYWGVNIDTGEGKNRLGRLLEDLRTQYMR